MPASTPNLTVTVARPAKAWYASRTLWLNACVLMLLAAEAKFSLLQPLLPANVYACVAFALPVLNAVLRLITTTALSARALGLADVEAVTEVQVPTLQPLADMRKCGSSLDYQPTIPVDPDMEPRP